MGRQRRAEINQCDNAENHRKHDWKKPVGKKGWHLQRCRGVHILLGEIVDDVPDVVGHDDGIRGAYPSVIYVDEIQVWDDGYGRPSVQPRRQTGLPDLNYFMNPRVINNLLKELM